MNSLEKMKKFNIRKINSTQVIICLICFIISLSVTIQARTINTSESDILRLKRENELRDEIAQWKEVYEVANEKIAEQNKKIEDYRNASAKTDDTVALIKKELDIANLLAGVSAVKGPGITVTLDDSAAIEKIAIDAGYYNNNVYIIHDTDIMSIMNELSVAGAEAFSVNGQRIISTSAIRCVGPLIQINGINLSAPFTITAIGNPDTLVGSLNLRGGIISEIKSAQIDVTIEKHEEVTIPAYDKIIEYKYAVPVVEVDK
ncbi:MAG: DUF881 domain-containing protein [Clostridia bacterium]|nr:DUF881 domain-containing protein [Clostridia bacterium]